ncbi:MAG: TRAM domain-containing protein, partial [Clostridiaceae bacterium]|nr:TRAM domain-containing protein [Clostridiaceae bacterium]
DHVKKRRFEKLLDVQNDISRKINDKLLGSELEVLVEGKSKNNPEIYTGRTRTNKIINFEGDETLIGKLKMVKIEKVQTWSLEGKLVR